MTWVYFIANLAAGIAVVGVAAGVVRRASKTGGLLLAAAGLIHLLTTCCFRVTNYLQTSQEVDLGGIRGVQALMVGSSCVDLLVMALFAVAFVTIAKELRPTKQSG